MIYNRVVDTVVLLVYWNRRFSHRLCFHIVDVMSVTVVRDDGRKTVSEQGVQRIHQRKLRRHKLKGP